ncbi:MAG: D-alanine-D-alanine ligase [Parcubacteria group bacterium Gr01-1014_70]|nr:MAG: D-alanine-D-alanine ligase [Parcubacteria group bacterium Gr01-1014_70]
MWLVSLCVTLYNCNVTRQLKIGVVMGGPSSEHEISLLTGRNVLRGLVEAGHDAHPVYIAHSGNWFLGEKRGVAYDPTHVCGKFDVMFNATHGEFGEDGRLQQIFERCNVPYTGSGVAASALAWNKTVSCDVFKNAGLVVPRAVVIYKNSFDPPHHLKEVHWMSAAPWVVKPAACGSSVGVSIAYSFPELERSIAHAFSYGNAVRVEEHINGREITCGVLEDFNGEKYHALHPIEIIPPEGRFFDYQVKYDGSTKEIPAPFFGEMLRHVEHVAVTAHKALGCRHYSRTDMIIKKNKIYVLETNTLPGLTAESLFPKAASWAKLDFPRLCEHIVQLALS